MKRSEAFPSNYLGKDDFPSAIKCEVKEVVPETVKGDGKDEEKAVMYFSRASDRQLDLDKGLIVNNTNWQVMEHITGSDDSDDWTGTKVEVYVDPTVMFGKKRVGGLRLREVAAAAAPQPDPAAGDNPAHAPDEAEIPF